MKDTLKLPKTEFPIAPNFKEREQTRYEKWRAEQIYDKMKGDGKGDFILHDGPPYANGDIHVGHALNKILKDFIVKLNYFNGCNIDFVPGWDCHGLPIEQKVKHKTVHYADNPVKVRDMCREYAGRQVENQKEQFQALGIVADWDNPYLTMNPEFELEIYRRLVELLQKDLLYSQEKPVFWSWAAETALAEAEVEYRDISTQSAYVYFPTNYRVPKRVNLLIWTTTPWTLPSNQLIAAAKINYCLCDSIDTSADLVIVVESRVETLQNDHLVGTVRTTIPWEKLQELTVYNPLNTKRTPRIVFSEIVQEDKGTGFVHIAPGHGQEDYQVAIQNGIKRLAMPVGPDARYTKKVNELVHQTEDLVFNRAGLNLEGKTVYEGNVEILNYLQQEGLLCGTRTIQHSYPFCSRTEKPVIFRATEQWFLKTYVLEADAVAKLEGVKFNPESSKDRLLGMVKNRPDWCVSRQRTWGVPLAFLKNKHTGDVLVDCSKTIKVFEEQGVDAWWTEPVSTFVPDGCNPNDYVKVTDILDVWFDSGLSWTILGDRVADLYLEGHDQHRGWFQSSLWLSLGCTGRLPYKNVVTHGFVMDGQGEKMAKSKGNIVSPQEIVNKYGAEVLRYWVATTDYHKEVRCNTEILTRCSEGYKKIRNTLRFLLANLDSNFAAWCPRDTHSWWETSASLDDLWIIGEACKVYDEVTTNFNRYEFYSGMNKLTEFVVTKLSSIYMSSIKDRLYCDSSHEERRKACQYTLEQLLVMLLQLLAPILTYTAEEALEYAPEWFRQRSIFDFARRARRPSDTSHSASKMANFGFWLEAREKFNEEFDRCKKRGLVRETLEVVIGSLNVNESWTICDWFVGSGYADVDTICDWFGVSGYADYNSTLELLGVFRLKGIPKPWSSNPEESEFKVYRSPFRKCPRCWKRNLYSTDETCSRCSNVLRAIETDKEAARLRAISE